MRDIALTLTIFALLPVCFLRPWIGVLVWSWLGYMNPHRLTWTFAYDMAFAQMVAIATLGGFVLTRDRKAFIWSRESALILTLWLWFTVTTLVALYPEEAWDQWKRVSKILLMALLTIPLFQDRQRLRILLLLIAGSIGFYGFKGGPFAILTGGQWMILGPPGDTFISSNNAIGLALNMCLPLFFYLAREERRPWLRALLRLCFVFSIISVVFTYSRGALVGLAVVLSMLFLRSRTKLVVIPAVALGAYALLNFAPDKWSDRVETIWQYEEDSSANARLASWGVAYRLASDRPLTGGGFWSVANRETFARYAPEYNYSRTGYHDAHSIYFGVLAEHGYVGLGLYLLLMAFTLGSLRRLRGLRRRSESLAWISNYASMLQASIVAYLVTGTFLSVAYFDLAIHLTVLVVVLRRLAAQEVANLASQAAPGDGRGRHPSVQPVPPGLRPPGAPLPVPGRS